MILSVIMPVYKEDEFMLRRSIESILNQTFGDFEFIIVLDKPENEVAKKIISEYVAMDDRIVFLQNEQNLGAASSRERALEIARGEYVALQDADDQSLPLRFEKQILFFQKHPGNYILGTFINEYHKNSITKTRQPQTVNELIKRGCLITPATSMIKRNLLLESSLDTIYKNTEYEVFLRLYSKGIKIYNLNEYLYNYYLTDKSNTYINLKKQIFEVTKIKLKYSFKVRYNFWDFLLILKDLFSLLIPSKLLIKLIIFNKDNHISFYKYFVNQSGIK